MEDGREGQENGLKGGKTLHKTLHNNMIHNIEGSLWFPHLYLHRMDFLFSKCNCVLMPELAMKSKAGRNPHLCDVTKAARQIHLSKQPN
jgi:hypothetical protein